jgi:NAD(P) transhydrogenase
MKNTRYDLLVIGSGPAGQKAAIQAAKRGRSVALIDRKTMVGGVSLHGGTIPSKTLREAILYLSGLRQRAFYGKDYVVKEEISHLDLKSRVQLVEAREMQIIQAQLRRNEVDLFYGRASFIDDHTLAVANEGMPDEILQGDHILIACGTHPVRNPEIPYDGRVIIDSDEILDLAFIPDELVVAGAGIIGLEYASMFAALGIEVTIIDKNTELLEFVDQEIVERLIFHLRNLNVILRLGETIQAVSKDERGRVVVKLDSGKTIRSEAFLYAIGRQTNADSLNIQAAGLSADERGRIAVNENYQTEVAHIYAAGDVIGFPALAATSMEQGRLAGCHMFSESSELSAGPLPYGIYAIPEISMIGQTEQELTRLKVPYEFGAARFDELAKGGVLGLESGYLKILFDPESLKILGIHIIGEAATELIHIGQAVFSLGGTLAYFRDSVFNYPTLAEAYKVAALDGLNKL